MILLFWFDFLRQSPFAVFFGQQMGTGKHICWSKYCFFAVFHVIHLFWQFLLQFDAKRRIGEAFLPFFDSKWCKNFQNNEKSNSLTSKCSMQHLFTGINIQHFLRQASYNNCLLYCFRHQCQSSQQSILMQLWAVNAALNACLKAP